MNEQWYYAQNGVQKGPVSVEAMQQLFSTGQLKRDDLVWKEGMANWSPISSVPDLFASAPVQPPEPPRPTPAPEPTSASPLPPSSPGYMPPPGHVTDPSAEALSSKATTALVLGICSIVLGACICSPVGLGLGIPAVIMGKNAEGAPNAGNAKAGFVCGIIGIILAVIGCLPQYNFYVH